MSLSLAFDSSEYWVRFKHTIASMRALEQPIDVLFVTRPEHIYWLTNFQTPGNPPQLLIIHKDGFMFITRELEASNAKHTMLSPDQITIYSENQDAYTVIKETCDSFVGRVGWDYSNDRISYHGTNIILNGRDVVACDTLISKLCVVKSPAEILYIKKAAQLSYDGIEEGIARAKPGVSESFLAGKITDRIMQDGSEYTSYPCFVAIGESGKMGHYAAGHNIAKQGDLLFMEIGASYMRYHAARMHTIYLGQDAPHWFTSARELIKQAMQVASSMLKGGTPSTDVAKEIKKVLAKYEYPCKMSERCGYSIGVGFYVDWSENDVFLMHDGSPSILENNMVIHLIPWIQVDQGAIGFSDTMLVTKDGGVSLYPAESTLDYAFDFKITQKILADFIVSPHILAIRDGTQEIIDDMMDVEKQFTPLHRQYTCKGVKLLIKDESRRWNLKAFKIVGVTYAIDKLEEEGVLKKNTTLCSMTDGNHGLALAHIAMERSYGCVIYVPMNMTRERRQAIIDTGATCNIIQGYYDDCIEEVKTKAKENNWVIISDTAWKSYVEIPRNIIIGYTRIFHEVYQNLHPREYPTHVFLQAGVGGFAAAGTSYLTRLKERPIIVCVEPVDAACIYENALVPPYTGEIMCKGKTDSIMGGLNCGVPSTVAWPILRTYVDFYIAIGDSWSRSAMQQYNNMGIESGESGAASLGGLLAALDSKYCKMMQLTNNSKVLLVNCEGATDKSTYSQVIGCLY
uniref:Pyridoxal-phosphate dependent enzyme n=1 Tax=Megaviridae environmental sample TaxID=1737588 RepID=A0A5J6VJF0_9VIRU|nr:MAG: pyridoxal-phosphate dependent enzyme [Megaviridae environmental sample]